ncbi:histidine phosphatase superfamily protein (branch 1) [Paenibacillus pabuli]|uniref:Histidine phosphatase superfamily protein (Branch 1) n=1 Tax=Paenibacillus pabuli TaxID=1472 RepID=A0ABX9BMM8_9BACL|nr:histidine phosphatase family protein [Paenibacillus pabuli]RAI98308.1 histidine phosphatase superfamily protein (branch 1) [Paenibacillus pabuli]
MYRLFMLLPFIFLLITPLHSYASPLSEDPLINDLRKGGYILYVRHGEATLGEDQQDLSLTDCSTQRNLSARGMDQAKKYGEAIRKLHIPVNFPVESSPLCRTVQTAEAAFGKPNVTVNEFWMNIYELSKNINTEDAQNIIQAFKNEVERITPNTSNRVIIAHSFPQGMGLGDIPYMGTVILKPLGNHMGYEIVKRLTLEDVLRLAEMQ